MDSTRIEEFQMEIQMCKHLVEDTKDLMISISFQSENHQDQMTTEMHSS